VRSGFNVHSTKQNKGLQGTRRTRATDDVPWSPKTNSVSPASCAIASLARQGLITPNPATAYAARDDGHQSFLEGTVLSSAHKHVTPLGRTSPRIPTLLGPLQHH
jgi:hypothetical protein